LKRAYMLTGVDSELLNEFKSACAHYGMSMRATLLKHIQNIVNDYRMYQRGLGQGPVYTNKKGEK